MGGRAADPWFKVGNVEFGTTMVVIAVGVLSMLVSVFTGASGNASAMDSLAYSPWSLAQGEVWRPFTWPLVNYLGLWTILNLFFFWVFGTELESQLGRKKMAHLLLGIWAAMTVAATLVGLAFSSGTWLAGLGMIQFIVLLLWICEYPNRPFFFGIPAWVVGAVLLALQLLSPIGRADWVGLFSMLLSLVAVAVIARRLGLLHEFAWIPGAPKRNKPTREQKKAAKTRQQKANDQQKLDQLLDKISAGGGVDALSASERQELMRLRNRRQG